LLRRTIKRNSFREWFESGHEGEIEKENKCFS
jgi:hypothetical protein